MAKTIITKKSIHGIAVKASLSLLCLAFYTWHLGFAAGSPWYAHALYSFCHANVFHLMVNLVVLWQIRGRIPVLWAWIVAVACSYLPMYVQEPTMGLSGLLFASFGIMWGKTGRIRGAALAGLPFIFFTMLLSGVNGLLHLYTYIIGYFFGKLFHSFNRFFS